MSSKDFPTRLKLSDIERITGWSRWTITRRTKSGVFPMAERVGDTDELTWREDVVQDWLDRNVRPAYDAKDVA